MSAKPAVDRLDDSFPHGTPAGFKDGCRGNGGCPNRDSSRMTCKEASTRYARDLAYRRAYDSGDIWLDRPELRDPEAERVRTSLARRTQHQRGIASDPTRAVIDEGLAQTPKPTPRFDPIVEEGLAEAGRQIGVALDRELKLADLVAEPEDGLARGIYEAGPKVHAALEQIRAEQKPEPEIVDVAGLLARIAQLEQERDRAVLALAEAQRYSPGQRPRAEFYSIGEQLHIGLNVLIDAESVQTLVEHLKRAS